MCFTNDETRRNAGRAIATFHLVRFFVPVIEIAFLLRGCRAQP
jgi:hypothetical protein